MSLVDKALEFVAGPVGSLATKVLGVLLGVAILLGLYKVYETNLINKGVAQEQQKELTQLVTDQQKLIGKLQAIQDLSQQSVDALQKKNDGVHAESQAIHQYIRQPTVQDRESSDVLKETVRRLKEGAPQ